MTAYYDQRDGEEFFEYHGNTSIERIRRKNGIIRREWLCFDSIEEAEAFFNDQCACCEAV
ncbi:MAG: hypothetical protein C4519_01320 [Desulfobacteraceae bacterium]|nr:MAG: hypothetical protein C4519_01320 [Desulfobacteraceae bacterium]